MGKSPGRWIKSILFGKKQSKSNLSQNAIPDKQVAGKTPAEDLPANSPVISDPDVVADNGAENFELEKKGTSGAQCGTTDVESQSNFVLVEVSDAEMTRQNQASTKVQAAFRGYLARRAFRALKGIIRLQALIRGHLVRRQAVATLRCMQAVIKFQAFVRGRRTRLSEIGYKIPKKHRQGELQDDKQVDIGANSILKSEKLSASTYCRKLVLSLPIGMPLNLQYDVAEPNSAWQWLERWSLSRFWEPPVRPRKISNVKPQRKLGGFEYDAGKSRRTNRKSLSAAHGDHGTLASFDSDKPRKNSKGTSHQTELVQEQPQNELEKVKRNLRKISASVTAASEKLENESEKPEQQLGTKSTVSSAVPEEQENLISAEVPVDIDVGNKQTSVEATLNPITITEPVDIPHEDHPLVESHHLENDLKVEKKSSTISHEEMSPKEDKSRKEGLKVQKRRSLPAKQEFVENMTQNTPSLPSYMAATESAKAKLRAQALLKFSEDGVEHGYVRRHSLPASTNGKMSALSQRIQKPMQANGKGSGKTFKSTPSREGWRR